MALWLSCLLSVVVGILVSLLMLLKKKTKSEAPDSSSSSTSDSGCDYEVFLGFRGIDTRTSFTDFLYNVLVEARIHTFRDNDELRIGEEIGPELLKAIQHSKICIPIFSKNYAYSKWCLRELAHMVECRRTMEKLILPIFYDVEPSDVRHQTGCYEEAFCQHEQRFDNETVQGWRDALTEVGALKGWEVGKTANGHQGQLIKLVVAKVWGELKKSSMVVTDYLVGIDYHVEKMKRLLNVGSCDVRIVGIHGMGGIGKTTIAKVIYNQLSQHFECCSFIADVRETSQQQHKGLVYLQNQLISNLLKRNKKFADITNVDEGINVLKDRFRNKKVLVVLDDVDEERQFNALARKRDWFGSGSRIIVTTRDKHVLNVPQVKWTYEPKEMDPDQSLQLFSKHAFRRLHPPAGYITLSRDIVSTAAGLPLALEVIGSFLSDKGKEVWNVAYKKLKMIPDDQVQKKLRISYEALGYEQKQIFLDIACLFIGMDRRIAVHMWDDCNFFPDYHIEVLLLKSLIKIGYHNELRMHDQLRDLGREIVRQENVNERTKRSRLWSHEDSLDVLQGQKGTAKVEALCLDFGFESQERVFTNKEFAKLSNLRFIQLGYADMAGDFEHLLEKLRWLRWEGCPQNFTPTNFHLKNLIILDLSWSKVTEGWEGWSRIEMAKKLKVLNLTGCSYLTRTPEFSAYATLERLILEFCVNLVQIDPSIGHLKSLVFLDMRQCAKLNKLPQELGSLEALTEFLIDGTSIQEVPVSIGHMKKLEILSATNCQLLTRIPSSIGHLKYLSDLIFDFSSIIELPESIDSLLNLRCLSLIYCTSLETLPESIGSLKNLRVLYIYGNCIKKLPNSIGMLEKLEELDASLCRNLEGEIPSNFGRLSFLRILKLSYTNICSLPASICGLSRLQTLDLSGCEKLQWLPEVPSSLMCLRVTCALMETFPNRLNLNLRELCFHKCFKLVEIPRDIVKLSKLESLTVWETNISTLPTEIRAFSGLKELVVGGCKKLQCLPELPSSLFKLQVDVCESMERFPDSSNLKSLSELILHGCSELTEIHGLEGLELLTTLILPNCNKLSNLDGLERLESLRYLNICGCISLERLPDVSNLKKLQILVTANCEKLIEIQGLNSLESLERLNMNGCISLERLPDLSNMEMLKEIELFQCEKLHEIEGLEVLKSLEKLDMSRCISLERFPDLSNLKTLEEFRIQGCKKLTEIQGLGELESLVILDISGCKSLQNLPDLSNIRTVKR